MTRSQLESRYKMEKRIGQGGFGDVWLARDTRTGRRVAVKLLPLDRLPRRMVEQEVEAMRRCGSHPHVIELLAVVWVSPHGSHKNGEAALVMELAGGGGLFERLVSEGAYTEQLASKIMRQIALAVYHLHSRGILHRDLKPENVVFDSDAADATVKLIDFGTAVALEGQGEQVSGGGRIGTWSYWAPEQLAQQPYGFEVDMWSLGVLLYILLVGFHPFDPDGESNEAVILANMRADHVRLDAPEWAGVSDQAKQLVTSLLQPDPAKRLSAADLVSHPWVLGRDVPGKPMPATQERLRAFIQARHAFYGSLLMGLLVHQLAATDAEGMSADVSHDYDVMGEGWRLLDRDGKGHIDANDLWRVCMDMGYKVTQRDVEQMMAVLAPTAESQELGRTRRVPTTIVQGDEHPSAAAGTGTASGGAAGGAGGDPEATGRGGGGDQPAQGSGGAPCLRRESSAQPSATISFDRYRKTMAASFSRTFGGGDYIFREGDPVDAFYVITRGACEVRVAGPDGGERQIATLGPGDFFGETGLLEGREVRAASVLAKTPVEVLAIDKGVFNEIARADGASTLSASMRERAEERQRARLMKVFEAMSVSLSQRRSFAKGQVVYQQGQPAETFYIVNRGSLEMSLSKPDGGSVTVKRLKPGDHLGYDAIFSEVHDTTVTCMTDVELTAVPQDELRLVISKDRYFSTTVKGRQRAREGLQQAASEGEAQLLPTMMAAALAAGEGAPPADYGRYESMIAEMDSIHLGSGEAVFHQGDTPEKVYFVTSGRLDCEYDPQLDRQGAGPSIAAASAAAVEKLGWKAAKAKARAAARAAKGQGGAPASGPGAAAAPEDAPAVSAPVDPAASDDREQRLRVVATLRPGDHFGETAMLEGRDRRNLTVRCVAAACELRAMSFPRFSAFLRESSQLQQTVERAAEMRTNQRIRKVIEAAAQADLTLRECARGEIIFRQGEPSDAFYLVESGEVVMSLLPSTDDDDASDLDVEPIPVRRCGPGECFGASGLLPGDNVRRNTATATSPVVLKVIPHSLFHVMLRDDAFLQAGLKASQSFRQRREAQTDLELDEMQDKEVQKAMRK